LAGTGPAGALNRLFSQQFSVRNPDKEWQFTPLRVPLGLASLLVVSAGQDDVGDGLTSRIVQVRGLSVMLDADLAALYGVSNKALLQAVRRNPERFPPDFIIQINGLEWANLRPQIVSASGWGGRRSPPWAFTEHGALQLASVLRSARAAAVSLLVVRAFVRLRQWAQSNREIILRLEELERRVGEHDDNLQELLAAIRRLIAQPAPASRPIGFTADLER